MKRRIITIDEEKCNGCGLCAEACHEGAIGMIDGKAKLLRDDYCDGLGDCLPTCPTGAITFVEREALPFDKAAVEENMKKKSAPTGGCPGSRATSLHGNTPAACPTVSVRKQATSPDTSEPTSTPTRLMQWPLQVKLMPITAPYYDGANLLIAADCAAYSCGNFHEKYMKNHITIIGCPKLDSVDYSEKLTAILQNNNIRSVKIVRMEVPCCSGLTQAAVKAIQNCGKMIPWQWVTLSLQGEEIDT